MEIQASGLSLIQRGASRADAAAERIVKNPVDPADLVELNTAKRESEIGARLVRTGDDLAQSVLDVLA